MDKRKFITVDRVGTRVYWDCPGKCGGYKDIPESMNLPLTIHCNCGHTYIVRHILPTSQFIARVLIEVKDETKT